MENFLLGFLLATLLIGGWAWFEVKQYTFNSIEYRKEIKGFYEQNNDFIRAMERAGFAKYEVPDGAKKLPPDHNPLPQASEGREKEIPQGSRKSL